MITFDDITTGEKEGRGFYDELMRTMSSQLRAEYEAGRIVGVDYATAYIALLQTALGTAAQVAMQIQLNNKQLEIMDEQLKQAEQNTDLIKAQIRRIEEEILVSAYNRTELMPLQKQQLQEQIAMLVLQQAAQTTQNQILAEQLLGQKTQNDNLLKEGQLLDEKIKTETTNTTDATGGMAKAALDKTVAEKAILTQKLETEKAQTTGVVNRSVDGKYTATVGGMAGAEMILKTVQGESFIRDAEQKAAKFYADTLGIVYSTNPDGADADQNIWGLGNANSANVMGKLLDGIGVRSTP